MLFFALGIISCEKNIDFAENKLLIEGQAIPEWFDTEYASNIQYPDIQTRTDLNPKLLSKQELADMAFLEIKNNGGFSWSKQSSEVIWSGIRASEGLVSIGVKPIDGEFSKDEVYSVDLLRKYKTYTAEFIIRSLDRIYPEKNILLGIFNPIILKDSQI